MGDNTHIQFNQTFVYGLKTGNHAFSATFAQGTANGSISLASPVTSVRFAQKLVTLTKGQKIVIPATAYASRAYKAALTWRSNKPGVVSVAKNGKLTAKKAGSATITVTTENNKTAKLTVKVVAQKIPVSGITVTGCAQHIATLQNANHKSKSGACKRNKRKSNL